MVASYNLQHPAQFTDAAIAGLRELFIAYLDQGVAVVEARRPVLRHWPMTIADVYIPGQPEGAAERVKAWAASIRAELAA